MAAARGRRLGEPAGARPTRAGDRLSPGDHPVASRAARRQGRLPATMPFTAPRTLFNATITARRSVAFTDVSLADIKKVKDAFGVTVNDVVTAVVGGALRHYLEDRGELPDHSLLAAAPVSVHDQTAERVRDDQGLGDVLDPRHRRKGPRRAAPGHRRRPTLGPRRSTRWSARTHSCVGLSTFGSTLLPSALACTRPCTSPTTIPSCTTSSCPTCRDRRSPSTWPAPALSVSTRLGQSPTGQGSTSPCCRTRIGSASASSPAPTSCPGCGTWPTPSQEHWASSWRRRHG